MARELWNGRCGLVLGIAILTMFALFEKHRNEVRKVLEDLKHWR